MDASSLALDGIEAEECSIGKRNLSSSQSRSYLGSALTFIGNNHTISLFSKTVDSKGNGFVPVSDDSLFAGSVSSKCNWGHVD